MADFGVTPYGYVRMRLPEIRQAIVDDLTARLHNVGITGPIETRPDSVTGLLIDTFADREAALWEQSEAVYLSMYPGSASGISLDYAVSFTGVTRLPAEPSRAYVVAYGAEGTVLPAGVQIRNQVTQTIWATTEDTTITAGAAGDVSIRPTVANSTLYRVTIDGVPYSYNSDVSANIGEILGGLVAAVSVSGLFVSSDGAVLHVTGDGRITFAVALTGPLTFAELGSVALAATEVGLEEESPVGVLNQIVTTVTGWDRVNNLQAGVVGRQTETDAELRARYSTGVYRLGAATLPSIAPNILEDVPGISAIKVFENDSDVVAPDGQYPHSIHVVVQGGLVDEIGMAIYRVKAAGIDTFGAVEVFVPGDDGVNHAIYFDRPTPVYIWAKAVLTLLPPAEEQFPVDGNAQVANNIVATGELQEIGQDVIVQRYYCAIFGVPGIASIDLKFAHSTNPAFVPAAGDYSAANITIEQYELAVFDISRVTVT
ncbi:MAG TPA: baseplate J/gp47 family protein [Pseudolabrys sp.]|jgi:uncharacterized phage protein gp47/JayE|nr:baseplate J/gp47 family protein [Pseudolabrys sp.]